MTSPLRILLLEDDPSDAELVHELLEADHFNCEIARVQTRAEFVAALERPDIDLILSDYALPSFDGLSALELALRARPDLPFIFVSGTLGEEAAIDALKIGATDYVLKTRLSRLVPAVQRALREARDRSERKRAEETLREQASLLSLTHDAILGHDMNGVITYWNRAAETLYGWTAEEAEGKNAPVLLKTVFPVPLDRIKAELLRDSRWEGELVRTRKDGTQVVLASRWSLQRSEQGSAIAILETDNDITERKRAEQARQEAARRSEKELRDVIEAIPAIAFTTFPDGSSVWINRRWVEYSGLSVKDTSGMGWQSAIHPDDRERHVSKWRESLIRGEPFENEARHRGAEGKYRWFLVRAVPLRDERGNIVRWYGTLTDIEDRKQAEALLAEEKRILEMVASGASLAQILDSLCRLAEGQAEDVLASILLAEGDRLRHGGAPSLPKAYTDAIDGGLIGPSAGSCGTAAFTGKQVIVSDIANDPLWADYRTVALPHSLRACWSTPIFSQEGKVIGTFAMYYQEPREPSQRDQELIEQISHLAGVAIQRTLAEEKVRESEARYRTLVEHAPEAIVVLDVNEGRFVDVNENAVRLFGLSRDTLMQLGPVALSPREQPDGRPSSEVAQEKIRSAVEGSEPVFEWTYLNVAGQGIPSEVRLVRLPATDRVLVRGSVTDISERKRVDEERERLRQLEAHLAHINRVSMMGELAASLAHEIKQPMAAAVMNASACKQWLRRELPDLTEACQAASATVANVTRAADIIDRVRSLYRRDTSERQSVDLNGIIREMTVLLGDTASRSSISIRTKLDRGIPPAAGDRVQLQQVLMNLMLNGIEAMKNNGGELTVTSARADEGHLLISVTDSGIGLPVEETERIFEAFFTTKLQGTGMGLSISRRIIESHGGRLWASANARRGATFRFTLPIEMTAAATPSAV